MNIIIHAKGSVATDCAEEDAEVFATVFPVTVVNPDGTETPMEEWLPAQMTATDAVIVELSGTKAKVSKAKG
jgi:hypothetical protein